MKTILLNILITLALSSTLLGQSLTYTTSVNSSPGQNYSVYVTIVLTDIITTTNNCTWGYNYDVAYDYDIQIISNGNGNGNSNGNGTNSVSLNTLQGYLSCGSNQGIYFNLPNNGGSGSNVTQVNAWNSNSDCATATVESLQCNFIDLQIQGPGIPNQYIVMQPSSTLPVEWLSFQAINNNDLAELNWSTGSEKNNDYFTVEKSIDGKQWTSLGEVEAAGNTNSISNYSWTDKNPSIGKSYYRIKQTDFDGRTDYSSIESFDLEGAQIELYPNPATNVINIKSESQIDKTNILILNSFGQDVSNRLNSNNSNQFDVSSLPAGFYSVFINGNSTKFQKL